MSRRVLPRTDLPGLTSLRALAALLVFGYHMGTSAPVRVFGAGYVGVAFFFVLSGFVLTWGTNPEKSHCRFYLRRFARIYPSHVAVWALVLVLPIVSGPKDTEHATLNLLLLQAWSPRLADVFSVNGVTWSLSCEMFFYALFPLVFTVTRKIGLRTQWMVVGVLFASAGTFVCIASFASADSPLALVAGANPLVHAPEFLLGVIGARTLQSGRRITVPYAAGVVVLAAVGVFIVHGSPALAVWATPVFLCVILAVAQTAVRGRPLLAWPWLVYCGRVSFCFYLVHQLILNEILAEFGHGAAHAVLGFLASCIVAVALHHGVELPAQRLIVSRSNSPK